MTEGIRTVCPYCGVGCGLVATRNAEGTLALSPDPDHPANRGRICSKGAALGETLGLEGRLLHPRVDGRRTGWDEALDRVANGFSEVIRRHGPEAVAFYVSGQLLTEDYYVANKLMKGFIGSANIDTNSRLCMSSSVAGHKRAFGSDTVPGCYEDLDTAELVVLAGSNAAWCHPVLYQRLTAARERHPGRRLVVIDPRGTATTEGADLHLALRPGSDVLLFSGLLVFLEDRGKTARPFVDAHTDGRDGALAAARRTAPDIAAVAAGCGLAADDVRRFYEMFAATERCVTLYSQGVNQSSSGTDKVNAILNCHLLTGRVGRPGMGPFSLTGQPNAMGGREVGGLANQLAAHLELDDPAHRSLVREFWQSPTIASAPGAKAVDLFRRVEAGEIKAVWIMATNPAVSLPDAGRVGRALAACDLVVVSDCVERTDTTAHADVLLPAAAWGEKSGTVTNSERRISRQRAFLTPPGEARPDWWIIAEVARRMGFGAAFAYRSEADIFREHAALSGCDNHGRRAFDISGLAALSDAAYAALEPVQWPVTAAAPSGTARLFADGAFFTPGRRACFVAVSPTAPVHAAADAYPLVLNTGRLRDHWHTMTRTGASPRLSAHADEPSLALHPQDAAAAGVSAGDLAEIESRWGKMTARVVVDPRQRPGSLFAPIHWSGPFAGGGRVGDVVNPEVDPISGQPELKHTPVRIRRLAVAWEARVLARRPLEVGTGVHWVRARRPGFWRYRLAGPQLPGDCEAWARALVAPLDGHQWSAYRDPAVGRHRFACFAGARLEACVFVGPVKMEIADDWIGELFAKDAVEPTARLALLAGRAPPAAVAGDQPICACFGIGRAAIEAAARKDGASTVEKIGAALGAGTNCGSCKPEIAAVLKRLTAGAAA